MADTPNDLEQEVAALIAAGFTGEQPQNDAASQEQTEEQEGKRFLDVDLYRLPNGGVLLLPHDAENSLDTAAIESDETATTTDQPPPEPAVTPLKQKPRNIKPSYVLVPLLFLFVLTVGTLSYVFLLPLTATAQITITPLSKTLHSEKTLTITPNPKPGEVQGRTLQSSSLTKSQTIAATGHGHQDATSATGVITFYNSDSSSITIPAGATFTTTNGATIVTDNPVTIQAAVPPVFGQGIAPAHVVQAGSIGNIAARAIYTKCCGSVFVTATNIQEFTGGQDARDYSFVQSSDIRNAQDTLLTSLTPQVTTALAKQLHTGEQLLTPLCSQHTNSSGQPGEEAVSVTVSVTQTCMSVAYSQESLEQVATTFLVQSQNLTNYQQAGTVQATVNGSTYEQHTVQLQVTLSGIWVYRFSQSELIHLKHMVAGATKENAQTFLKSQPGVQEVSISLHRFDVRNQLPTDPSSITMQFVYIVS